MLLTDVSLNLLSSKQDNRLGIKFLIRFKETYKAKDRFNMSKLSSTKTYAAILC